MYGLGESLWIGGSSRMKEQKVTYTSLFWLFVVGSVLGFFIEGFWCIIQQGHWEHHAATVWGPFCIIYGIGAVVVYVLSLYLKDRSIFLSFAVFTVAGAAVEYVGSLFQEICFGSTSWDYSQHFLSLGGRVSLKMALIWGILGVLFVKFLLPLLQRLLIKMQGRGWTIITILGTVFMVVNLLITSSAVWRWKVRQEGMESSNVAEQWLDETYGDEKMKSLFPNMQFK